MKLSAEDSKLFFSLMKELRLFINKRLNLFPRIKTIDDIEFAAEKDLIQINDTLFCEENINLIDDFIKCFQHKFSKSELNIVASWKKYIAGDFFIERMLKNHAIFIGGGAVYGVSGLFKPLSEMIPKQYLPQMVKTTLLPFKGIIVYDGFLRHYSISFGGEIKEAYKEEYMAAKQNGRIILSLEGNARKKKRYKNWEKELKELAVLAKKIKGSSDSPAIHSPAFALVRASIELALAANNPKSDIDDLYKVVTKVERANRKVEKVIEYMDW